MTSKRDDPSGRPPTGRVLPFVKPDLPSVVRGSNIGGGVTFDPLGLCLGLLKTVLFAARGSLPIRDVLRGAIDQLHNQPGVIPMRFTFTSPDGERTYGLEDLDALQLNESAIYDLAEKMSAVVEESLPYEETTARLNQIKQDFDQAWEARNPPSSAS